MLQSFHICSALPVLARTGLCWTLFFVLFWLLGGLGRSGGVLVAVLGRLGAVLEPSWAVLGGLGAVLGHLGVSRGRFGAAQETPRGAQEAPRGGLGVVLERLGEVKIVIFLTFFNDFCQIDVLNEQGHLGRS